MFKNILKNKRDKKEKNVNIVKREIIFDLLVSLCLIIMAIVISPKTLQNDTFYTIKCGEFVFQNGVFNLKSDPFSWLDLPYTFPHWLYDLMIYIIYAKAGWDGIYVSTIVFASILGLLLYNNCLYRSENRVVSVVISLLTMYLLQPYITARAQLVTFVLFAIEILFIEKFLDSKKIRYAVGLVVIAALIAQLHVAVFPMFFIFTLPYLAECFWAFCLKNFNTLGLDLAEGLLSIKKRLNKDEKIKKQLDERINKIKQKETLINLKVDKITQNPYKLKVVYNKTVVLLLIVVLVAFLTGFLHPTGDTAFTYLIKTMAGNTTASINEHQPVILANSDNFTLALCMFLFILIFLDIKIRLSDFLMLAGVTTLAIMSRRQISIFGLAACPILARLVADFFEKYDQKTCTKLLIKATSVIGVVIIAVGVGFIGYHYYEPRMDEAYINENEYPVKACDWILENLDVENLKLFNEYNYGSYLIYRGIPVIIDSRADLYAPEFNNVEGYKNAGDDIFNEILDVPSLGTGYEKIFSKYGVNHVMLYSNAKLALLLDTDDNYHLLYNDDNFKIYERLNAEDGE